MFCPLPPALSYPDESVPKYTHHSVEGRGFHRGAVESNQKRDCLACVLFYRALATCDCSVVMYVCVCVCVVRVCVGVVYVCDVSVCCACQCV